MPPKPTDHARFDFIREFHVSLFWSEPNKLWVASMEAGSGGSAFEKTPRRAIDTLMRFTRQKPSPK